MSEHETPPRGGPPEHLRLMLARFRRGCEVCGAMDWFAMPGGAFNCGSCGNVFDVPLLDDDDSPTPSPE